MTIFVMFRHYCAALLLYHLWQPTNTNWHRFDNNHISAKFKAKLGITTLTLCCAAFAKDKSQEVDRNISLARPLCFGLELCSGVSNLLFAFSNICFPGKIFVNFLPGNLSLPRCGTNDIEANRPGHSS